MQDNPINKYNNKNQKPEYLVHEIKKKNIKNFHNNIQQEV